MCVQVGRLVAPLGRTHARPDHGHDSGLDGLVRRRAGGPPVRGDSARLSTSASTSYFRDPIVRAGWPGCLPVRSVEIRQAAHCIAQGAVQRLGVDMEGQRRRRTPCKLR